MARSPQLELKDEHAPRLNRSNASIRALGAYFAIDAALAAMWWDCALICADTKTSPNASIHTITIVANAIIKGRALRSSIALAS